MVNDKNNSMNIAAFIDARDLINRVNDNRNQFGVTQLFTSLVSSTRLNQEFPIYEISIDMTFIDLEEYENPTYINLSKEHIIKSFNFQYILGVVNSINCNNKLSTKDESPQLVYVNSECGSNLVQKDFNVYRVVCMVGAIDAESYDSFKRKRISPENLKSLKREFGDEPRM